MVVQLPMGGFLSDAEYEEAAGLDGVIFVEFMRMLLRVFVPYTLWCALLLIVYGVARVQDASNGEGAISSLAFANLKVLELEDGSGDPSWWAAIIMSFLGIYLLTFLTLWSLKRSWLKVITWRQRHLTTVTEANALSVLVRRGAMAHSLQKAEARKQWEELYPGEIYDVRMVREHGKLPSELSKRSALLNAIAKLNKKQDKTRTEKRESLIAKKEAQVQKLQRQIKAAHDTSLQDDHDKGHAYFVLFKSLTACNAAKQQLNTFDISMSVKAAPTPSQVRWNKLTPAMQRKRKGFYTTAQLIYYAMLFFYAIPIGFISLVISLDSLQKNMPFIEDLLNALGPVLKGIIAAFLPTLALLIFMALLPDICNAIAGLCCHPDQGSVMTHAFEYLWFFNFFWVFFGITIASSLIETVQAIIDDPDVGKIVTCTVTKLSSSATFFMTYLLLLGCVTIPLKEFTRLVPNIKMIVFKKLGLGWDGDTPPPEPAKHEIYWTYVCLSACIGFTYVTIAPISVFIVVFFLFMCHLVYARNLMYSYTPRGETHGAFWAKGSAWTFTLLGVGQFITCVLHYLKASFVTGTLLLPPLVLSFVAARHFRKHYEPQLNTICREASQRADAGHKGAASSSSTVLSSSASDASTSKAALMSSNSALVTSTAGVSVEEAHEPTQEEVQEAGLRQKAAEQTSLALSDLGKLFECAYIDPCWTEAAAVVADLSAQAGCEVRA